jgi:phosphoglycolate phosphatase
VSSPSRVALFDLDGTLLNTRPGILACIKQTATDFGHTFAAGEDLNWLIGPPMEQSFPTLFARWGDPRGGEAVLHYRRLYVEVGLFNATHYPGLPAALEALVATGWVLFVATSKRTRFARPVLEHFGLAGHFRTIYGSEDGPRLDDKPELLAHIIATEGFTADRAVMIGDRRYDIAGARANGMPAIGAGWGYADAGELAAADAVAASPAELPGLTARLVG